MKDTKNISGFPEFLPHEQIAFNAVLNKIRLLFELNGFIPLDTPAVERVSTLLAKGNDNEIYGLYRLADPHAKEKDLALRFDLTVPLARYVAQHYGRLTFPYLRYQISPVWRGERPQKGRYRQFYQCDIDIIGDGSLSLTYDAQALSVIHDVFHAIDLPCFVIKLNNRLILTGLIQSFGISENNVADVMRTLDKAEKIGPDVLKTDLEKNGLHPGHIQTLLSLRDQKKSNDHWISDLKTFCDQEDFSKGIKDLEIVLNLLRKDFDVCDGLIQIDPTLARGLNYYTGTVSEVTLPDYPELGSVCGGGRYANLADHFSDQSLPGVGFSIGISRLIPKLMESGKISTFQQTPAVVLVTVQEPALLPYYMEIARTLRKNKMNTEVYLEKKSLAAQMKYAHRKGFLFAIIANETEFQEQKLVIRTLKDGTQQTVSLNEMSEIMLAKIP